MMIDIGCSAKWAIPLAQGLIDESSLPFVDHRDLQWLILVAKITPDSPDVFPKGKWASIQHLEFILEEAL